MIFNPDSSSVTALHPSRNVGERRNGMRPYLIILHYTGMGSAQKAIEWLAHPESNVSCHYVIDEAGAVTQMVPESLRAWHAGASYWHGETDVNSASIGIEIQNAGHPNGYPDFPKAQMQSVAELCRDIARRRTIAPEGVLAHSDVAPGRKMDPGEKFDWAWLASEGVGHWVQPAEPSDPCRGEIAEGIGVAEAQRLLRQYGYDAEPHGRLDDRTRVLVRAFQLHFRPARADGRLDTGTLDTLARLVAALPVPVTS